MLFAGVPKLLLCAMCISFAYDSCGVDNMSSTGVCGHAAGVSGVADVISSKLLQEI